MAYNGRVQNAASVGKIMLGSDELTSEDYDMTVSSAINAGDILTVTVTAKVTNMLEQQQEILKLLPKIIDRAIRQILKQK